MTSRRARFVTALCIVLGIAQAGVPIEAYLKFGSRIGDRVVSLRWNANPVRYFVNNRGVAGVTVDQLQSAVDRAFRTWHNVAAAEITFESGGLADAAPLQEDGRSTLGFLNRPDMDRTVGLTSFLIDNRTGEILEADIFFNAAFQWSVAAGGEPERFDLESVAVHEIGHLLGLGHSAIGETEVRAEGGRRVLAAGAVMFPIAFTAGNIADRDLKPDDIAGVTDLYPASGVRARTGAIVGRVSKDGATVFGAHLIAFSLQDGTLVGGFSVETDGGFTIAGLEPGVYVVRVEPLDDASEESFFADVGRVDIDFRVSYVERLVIVPSGGSSERLDVKVTPR